MQQKVNAVIQKEGLEGTAKRLNTTVHTLQLIIDGLTQPEGFDIRTGKLVLKAVISVQLFILPVLNQHGFIF